MVSIKNKGTRHILQWGHGNKAEKISGRPSRAPCIIWEKQQPVTAAHVSEESSKARENQCMVN